MKGKIDVLADDLGGNVLAIQVKTSVNIDKIKVHRIKPERANLGVFSGYRETAQSMIKYVAERANFPGKNVIPLIIELPGGEGNENAVYNQMTGKPQEKTDDHPSTTDLILDQFFSEVWEDE